MRGGAYLAAGQKAEVGPSAASRDFSHQNRWVNKTTKSHGGAMAQVLATLNGFRRLHGYWPNSLAAPSDLICSVATVCLTPLGFFLLQSKVDLIASPEGAVLARGHGSDSFSCSPEDRNVPSGPTAGQVDARYWLGLDDEDF